MQLRLERKRLACMVAAQTLDLLRALATDSGVLAFQLLLN
jgi:hypothetical protein